MRAAIYARTSTSDGRQDTRNQSHELEAWAGRLGYEVSKVYIDKLSGAKNADERPALQEALRDAHERRYDILLVWALDRLSRGGIGATAAIIERLKQSGVGLKSYKESWLDTSSPALAELLTAIFAWIARQERDRLADRIRAGLERAKRSGTRSGKAIGRPRLGLDMEAARLEIAKAGSIRKAALVLGCDAKTLRNRLAS